MTESRPKAIAAVLTKTVHYGEGAGDDITKAVREGRISARQAAAIRAERKKEEMK